MGLVVGTVVYHPDEVNVAWLDRLRVRHKLKRSEQSALGLGAASPSRRTPRAGDREFTVESSGWSQKPARVKAFLYDVEVAYRGAAATHYKDFPM